MYDEDDYLMLSGIQHFAFCRRQWALIHIEQQWQENYQTTRGELFHSKAHEEKPFEKRGNIIIARSLRIASRELGISGQCDIVEFHKDKDGIVLGKYEDRWRPYPVEYKVGEKKDGNEDMVQLCAQAMCLEEMLLVEIKEGSLFYGKSKRRQVVTFSDELRQLVRAELKEMHELYIKGYTPKVKKTKKCNACSLKEICLPKLEKTMQVSSYIDAYIKEQ